MSSTPDGSLFLAQLIPVVVLLFQFSLGALLVVVLYRLNRLLGLANAFLSAKMSSEDVNLVKIEKEKAKLVN